MIPGAKLLEEIALVSVLAVIVCFGALRGCGRAERLRVEWLELEELRRELHEVAPAPAGADYSPYFDMAAVQVRAPGQIDLNLASPEELEGLPGIGAVRAAEIVAARESRGGFQRPEDLLEIKGIGEVTFEKLRPFVFVRTPEVTPAPVASAPEEPAAFPAEASPSSVEPAAAPEPVPTSEVAVAAAPEPIPPALASGPVIININTATLEELQLLEGIGPVKAQRILEFRALHGPFQRPQDIMLVKGIGPKTFQDNAPLITVR